MRITLYLEEDAMYVQLVGAKVAYGRDLDDLRHLDYTDDHKLVGIEFLNITQGVDLDQVPMDVRGALEPILKQHNIKVFA